MRMKSPFSLLLAASLALPVLAQDSKAPPKADLAKGQALSTQVCGACHTADGSRGAPANPIIAGQHPEYLVKQLEEFKSGKRNNPVMKGFATPLSEADMRSVAAFYGSKQTEPGYAKNKDLFTLGQKIYRGGIADKQVPACAGCHSPTGAGIPSQYPRDWRPACRLHRGATERLPLRSARQQPAHGSHRRAHERPRDQGGGRLHRRPALTL